MRACLLGWLDSWLFSRLRLGYLAVEHSIDHRREGATAKYMNAAIRTETPRLGDRSAGKQAAALARSDGKNIIRNADSYKYPIIGEGTQLFILISNGARAPSTAVGRVPSMGTNNGKIHESATRVRKNRLKGRKCRIGISATEDFASYRHFDIVTSDRWGRNSITLTHTLVGRPEGGLTLK